MSKICIGIITKINQEKKKEIQSQLLDIVKKHDNGIFFSEIYPEKFFDMFSDDRFIFGLADNFEHNNCEMLLLPDTWMHNGKYSCVPFKKKISVLKDISSFLIDYDCQLDWFIGTSGLDQDDFQIVSVTPTELIEVMTDMYCTSMNINDLHIVITG